MNNLFKKSNRGLPPKSDVQPTRSQVVYDVKTKSMVYYSYTRKQWVSAISDAPTKVEKWSYNRP